MVDHLRRRLGEGGRGIVTKGQDAGVGDLVWEEVFQPERVRLRVGPGIDSIAVKAVNRDDAAIVRHWSASTVVLVGLMEAYKREKEKQVTQQQIRRRNFSVDKPQTAPLLSLSGEEERRRGQRSHARRSSYLGNWTDTTNNRGFQQRDGWCAKGGAQGGGVEWVEAKAGLKSAHLSVCSNRSLRWPDFSLSCT